MNEQKIASIIRNRFTKLYDDQRPIFDRVETYHQMYRAEAVNDDSWEWDYNLTDPVVFYLVRSMMAKFNPDSFRIRLEARNQKDLTNREINQQIVNWEMGEMSKTLLFYNFIFRGLLAGRAYMKTGWLFNKALEIKVGDSKQKVMRDIVNRGIATNVRFNDILVPNRNVPNFQDQPYFLERVMLTYGSMLDDNEAQGKEVWKEEYLKKIKEQKMFENNVDFGVDLPSTDDGEENKGKGDKADMFIRSQYVSMIRMMTKDNEEFYIPEKQNDWVMNTVQENKFWHGHYDIISWTPFPEDDAYDSMGVVQPVADLQTALTETLNQYLTNARKAGNPMWIAGSAAAQTPDWMFVNRPDGIIRVSGDSNQVTQVRHQDTAETMISMRRELMTSFERTTAMSSFFNSGTASTGTPQLNKTATGAKIIDSNIESSMQMLITLLGAQGISQLGTHLLELNAQYITEEQQIKISDRQGARYVNASPDQITANFDVIANGDTMTKDNPVVKQAQLLNLKGTIDAEKDVKFDKKPIWKTILASFPEMDGVEDVIIDPQTQAKDAINDLMNGVEPPINPDMDHKTIIKLVQVFMLSNPDMSDEQLKLFVEYLDDHRKYIEAEKILFTMEQPLTPTNPGLMGAQMGAPVAPTLPTGEQDLMKSLVSQNQLASNPTESLANKLPENVL